MWFRVISWIVFVFPNPLIMKTLRNPLLLLVILTALVQAQEVSRPLPRPASSEHQSPATVQSGQDVGEGEVVRVTASLVSVPVSVMDRQGKYVVDLQQRDFRIYEDGVEQPITHFSNVDQPFSVVLLMDTSGSTTSFLAQMKEAAKSFVEQLRPEDTVQPVYFHGEIKPLTTNSISNPESLEGGD